ncbi:MAG TPA: ribonuclease R [Firmicutes bacterium]|nr:ribonuclease R [Bacillota bacterium]
MGLKKAKTPEQLKSRLIRTLSKPRKRALNYNQLLGLVLSPGESKQALQQRLEEIFAEGYLADPGSARGIGYLTGIIQGNRRGFAFLKPDLPGKEDIYIKARHLKGAVHKDRVLVQLCKNRRGRREEGEVALILQRGNSRLVGTLERKGKRCYVVPDERRLSRPVEVSAKGLGKTHSGEKVLVKIDHWADGGRQIQGRVVERIGPADSSQTEQKSIRYKYNLPGDFPKAVSRELERLPGEDQIRGIAREQQRQDLRDLFTVTIDGESAKDFDDAISFEVLAPQRYQLGVHIADVSFYVRENGPLDKEAFSRGTSVYLIDQTIPMLPPLLSEQLCSLQAGKERLAATVLMEVNPEGELLGYHFFPSIIKVKQRLTYRQVQSYLEGGASGGGREELLERLKGMDQLAAALKKRRLQRGALDLDLPEAEIKLDSQGYPVSIERRNLGRAESLIEEFMILCNEVIAGHFNRKKLPGLYRVHAVPEEEKMKAFMEIISFLGYRLPAKPDQVTQRHLNQLLLSSQGKKEERLIKYLLLRSLPQACYRAANEGHFGLASRCYTHFTAPIRRYPDLIVHRLLSGYGRSGKISAERLANLRTRLPVIAQRSSERERVAMEAERASEDLAKALFMENKLGEEFNGIVSGVTNFGMFVELDNTVEGMIPLSDLDDDYYVYVEKQASLVGERRRKVFRLGDQVRVKVVRTSRLDGNVTFSLVEP